MSRIVITGGAGFIGSWLSEKLISQGHEVLCIDNFYTGNKHNLALLLDNPRFEIIRHDIVDPIHIECDQIYNLACPASPVHYQKYPVRTIKTCVQGAMNMLDLAQQLNCKILQASTSEVYGDPEQHPQTENYWGNVNPIGLRSCYDEGKRCAETLFFDYHRQYTVDIRVARIFNTYGPRMHENDGRVVSNFIVQALRGSPISIYGDGSQTRSFCFVDDTVRALMSLMNQDAHLGPINVGNPHEITVRELAHTIKHLTSSNSEIVSLPLPKDDPRRRQPNINKAREILDWQPTVNLHDGLQATIDYFRSVISQKS